MNKPAPAVLRSLPAVHELLQHSLVQPLVDEQGRERVLGWIRQELEQLRDEALASGTARSRPELLEWAAERVAARSREAERSRIGRVINATGVILHTGLGRAPLSEAAVAALSDIAGAGNLEIDLQSNQRRYRGHQLQAAWATLTGCQDSLVVNNNAAATLLVLQALCAGREVVISRGQLIEIGGSFRLPEIFELSGARLREVGTTNRTRLSDYERAIGPETAALMHVHHSNYRIVGFTAAPPIGELAGLAHSRGLIAIDDIGSGALVDVSRFGLPKEPTFPESIAAGADVVLGSGDKLLGGPQAGIVLGRSDLIQGARRHPLSRAVRVGKLTLAALSATLESYLRRNEQQEIPTLRMLATGAKQLRKRAEAVKNELSELGSLTVGVAEDTSPVGGGSLPAAELPTAVVWLRHTELPVDEFARRLRLCSIRVIGRVQHDRLILDLRSVLPEDDSRMALAVRILCERGYYDSANLASGGR